MLERLKETTFKALQESLQAVLPITVIVFLISVLISPLPVGTLILFLFGALLLILGMGLFTTGAEMALVEFGEGVGSYFTRKGNLMFIIIATFVMGFIVTIAEPDLQVLAALVQSVDSTALIWTVAAGVGLFLIVAVLRILIRIKLNVILIICYGIVFIFAAFVPGNFFGVAFDSGGVTTGPITVPFILALGLGIASVRGDKDSLDDSFGLVAICSVGPIIAVFLLGIIFQPKDIAYEASVIPVIETSRDATFEFLHGIPEYMKEVFMALWPIVAMLSLFQIISRRYSIKQLLRMLVGFVYVYIGLVFFMTGVNVGFIPVGQLLGSNVVNSDFKWLLIPIGAVIGYFIVSAEPAVAVLKKQIEDVSNGTIPGRSVQIYLSIGVASALSMAMLRALTGLSLAYVLIPGYIIAVALTFFTPKLFIGIAFDSGGVVTGPMTSTFLLPFAIGACADPSRIMTDAFGLVALIAMTPLLAIQIMGIVYKSKMRDIKSAETELVEEQIFEFEAAGINNINVDELVDDIIEFEAPQYINDYNDEEEYKNFERLEDFGE